MSRRTLIWEGDDISAEAAAPTGKKSFKNREKKLASRWPFPLDREFERQTAPFGRSKKVQKK